MPVTIAHAVDKPEACWRDRGRDLQGNPAFAPAPDDGGKALMPHQLIRQLLSLALAACVQNVDAGFTYTRNPVAIAE